MKSLKRNYELALAALEELAEDLAPEEDIFSYPMEEAERTPPPLGAAPLDEVLEEYGRLPRGALFLGAAYDGLPILLNLNDPTPGPILVVGDENSGKRKLLQMVAESVEQIHAPQEVQFGVITNRPKEWERFKDNQNCMGIFPSYENSADDFVRSLADWAHRNHSEERFALLMLDDLNTALKMNDDVQQSLRWLLLRGPNRRVWPIVTLDTDRRTPVLPWMDAFRTRLFGTVKNLRNANALLPMRGADLHLLEPGKDFVLYENRQWVKFWVPSIG